MSTRLPKGSLALLALVCLVFTTTQLAFAIQPVNQNEMYEIKLPEFVPIPVSAPDLSADAQQVTTDLKARYGGQWHVFSYNSHARTPQNVYGSGAAVAAAVRGPADLEQLARQVITDNPSLFRADPANLQLSATPHAKGKWVAHFQQTYHDLEVWQGKALVAFSDDGRLLVMSSDYYSNIQVDHRPTLSSDQAAQIAQGDVPFNLQTDRVEDEIDLLVLPVPTSVTEVEHRLVYRVRVRTEDPLGIWVTHVDAHDGEIVWRYNDIHFDYLGDTTSEVQEDTYCNGTTVQAMPYLRLSVSGYGQVYTDAEGNWSVTSSDSSSTTVTADLFGPYVNINNVLTPQASFSGEAEMGSPLTVAFDDLNAQRDERDVFDAINDIHDFFQLFAPEFNYANQRINAYVSRNDFYCPGNAWWDGDINFCRAAGSYANTGEIQGVAHHEFGHGIQDAILGWQGDQGLGEGNSDIIAILMTRESIIGRGFFQDNCTGGIRDANNTLIYPDDVIGQGIHYAGQVIAGFHWDSQQLLENAYGREQGELIAASNWHYGRVLMQPTTQPDQVFATFFADDDDGNLDNGTPNHDYYCVAAENHNFECPEILIGVLFSHEPLQDTTDSENSYTVAATCYSTEAALDASTIKTFWRLDGGQWNEVVMQGLGGDQYESQIPAQPSGLIEYYLYAEDELGNVGNLPRLAPDDIFDFLVAYQIDPLEQIGEWTVGAPDDNATTGVWEHVDPIATMAQPENDHTEDGTLCWITGQHQIGQTDGFNDVDGGKTTLFSAIYDLTGLEDVTIRYWKWYSNNRGNAPGQDYWHVEVSNDGGTTWSVLEHTLTSTNAWQPFTFDLADHFTEPGMFQLKFVASDEGTGSLVEAGIDDFIIVAFSGPTAVDEGDLSVRVVTDLGQNVPNPFNPRTEIKFNLARAGQASLRVYDLRGHLVKSLSEGELAAGPHKIIWDGTDAAGGSVAAGVYFYRLQTDDEILSKRMLLVK